VTEKYVQADEDIIEAEESVICDLIQKYTMHAPSNYKTLLAIMDSKINSNL
jgi:hypothetical protein